MSEVIVLLVMMTPMAVILLFANRAERSRERGENSQGFEFVAYLLDGGLQLMTLFAGAILASLGRVQTLLPSGSGSAAFPGMDLENPQLLAWGLMACGLVGLVVLLPPVRRLLARVLPINPASTVHAVALSMTTLIALQLFLTLAIGLGNLADGMVEEGGGVTIATVWIQALLFAALGFVGVGWPVRLTFSQTMERLGITRLTLGRFGVGLGLTAVMIGTLIAISAAASFFGIGFDENVSNLSEQLLGDLFLSPFGIATIGLAAALGEETIFRGALQPRFGILFTSLLFALTHSNYGITLSTLIVFVLGIILGLARKRYNTSTAMVIHAGYNIVLGILSYASIDFLDQLNP